MEVDSLAPDGIASDLDEVLDKMDVDIPLTDDTTNGISAETLVDETRSADESPIADAFSADVTANVDNTPSADQNSNTHVPDADATANIDNTPNASKTPNTDKTSIADEVLSRDDRTHDQPVSSVFMQATVNTPVWKPAPIKYINGMSEYEWEKAENIKTNKKNCSKAWGLTARGSRYSENMTRRILHLLNRRRRSKRRRPPTLKSERYVRQERGGQTGMDMSC
jgi:hypothetical protein